MGKKLEAIGREMQKESRNGYQVTNDKDLFNEMIFGEKNGKKKSKKKKELQ